MDGLVFLPSIFQVLLLLVSGRVTVVVGEQKAPSPCNNGAVRAKKTLEKTSMWFLGETLLLPIFPLKSKIHTHKWPYLKGDTSSKPIICWYLCHYVCFQGCHNSSMIPVMPGDPKTQQLGVPRIFIRDVESLFQHRSWLFFARKKVHRRDTRGLNMFLPVKN